MTKININTLRNKKQKKENVVWVTSYDYPQAKIVDQAGVDMILVGDSAGNTTHGFTSTIPVTMEMMLYHAAAVARGAKSAFLVGDMPYMSYQISNEQAIENAGKFIRCGMDAVKLEGDMPERIRAISNAGILVIGHLGLTPQSLAKIGGYKVQGKTKEQGKIILEQALRIQESGADILLLEAMPPEPAAIIAQKLIIPVYGIGAGDKVDGQLTIIHDILGLSFDFKCKFVKKYIDGETLITDAIKRYVEEVRTHKFPTEEHFYKGE